MESVLEVRWRDVRRAVCSCLAGGVLVLWGRRGRGGGARGGTYSRERSCSVRWSTAARAWREIASTSISLRFVGGGFCRSGEWGAQDAETSRCCRREWTVCGIGDAARCGPVGEGGEGECGGNYIGCSAAGWRRSDPSAPPRQRQCTATRTTATPQTATEHSPY